MGAPLGNKNAVKNKPWADAIRKFAVQNPDRRDKIIEKLYKKAEEGDLLAAREIIDRTEGKVPQTLNARVMAKEMDTDDLLDLYNELGDANAE